MAKIRTLQSALNAGELSPLLMGRPDIQRYQHGLERCRNALPLLLGGAARRPGSRHIGRLTAAAVRLLPFVLTTEEGLAGYVLEMSHELMRIYRADTQQIVKVGGVPVGIDTPYQHDELAELRYGQHENILYLLHPSHPPQRLQRISDTQWTLQAMPLVSAAFFRPSGTEEIVMRPSGDRGDITLAASADFFVAEHVGHRLVLNDGMVTITAVTDARTAEAEVAGELPDNETGNLVIHTFTVTLTKADIAAPCQVKIRTSTAAEKPLLTTFTGEEAGVSVATVSTNNLYRVDETTIDIDPALMAGDVVVTVVSTTKSPNSGIASSVTGDEAAGVAVTNVGSTPAIDGKQPDKDWQIEAWTPLYGYPAAIAFFEQRLLLAATPAQPATVWGSRTGKPLEFYPGTLDDDPLTLPISAAKTTIYHLAAGDQVFLLTGEQELTLTGAADAPLTPTDFQIKGRTASGSSSRVRPLVLGNELLFCSANAERLHVLRYALERDGYVAPDLAAFAEHLLAEGGGIVEMAYARRPVPGIWAATAQGHLLTLVYDPTQEVYAWCRHDMGGGGKVRSLLAIPDGNGNDRLWLAVVRVIDGMIQTGVEIFDESLHTDAAVTGTDAEGKATWGGLDHLEGEVVDVVADGYVYPRQMVSEGEITLPEVVKTVEIGLPFTTTIKDLPPFIEGGYGAHLSCKKARVLLHASKGCRVNGERIPFRQFGDGLLDAPVAAFTGWKDITLGGGFNVDGSTAQVEIIQDQPLPLTVLSIVKEVVINA